MLPIPTPDSLPAPIRHAGPQASWRFLDFFTANIRNPHTRAAYLRVVRDFFAWAEARQITTLEDIRPIVVAAYIEDAGRRLSKPTVKQHLAAIRMLFDWLVTGQILAINPAAAVRGPRYSVRRGKTAVLSSEEVRTLLDSIETTTLIGLRDRALIALMAYTFARVGAAISLKVEDYYIQQRRGWVRLSEKNGKLNQVPCHHNLEQFLEEWLAAADLKSQPRAPLFPALRYGRVGTQPLAQPNVYLMIQRRASAAGIATRICCHSFRATGITTYLKNGGKLEIAQQMAAHESPRTTSLYDRRNDDLTLDEIERVLY
ncbi:MAG: tyrosine-type recombinase/integrase [Bryobacterales bacterium]|nr:tyrosine-type recombinase/integrase [Bryobacterales bacterium]